MFPHVEASRLVMDLTFLGCMQRFLQPVGLVYNFHPVVASSLFPDAVE
jgi:hypothetical protein